MSLEKIIWQRLKKVIDPELGIDLVSLGLIYKVAVNKVRLPQQASLSGNKKHPKQPEKYSVKILMTLTTPGCPLAGTFDTMLREALKGIPGLDVEQDVVIELTFDPPWTAAMMSPTAKAELGFD
jgi:metal-sulfur cluster biosynthetic enzyme